MQLSHPAQQRTSFKAVQQTLAAYVRSLNVAEVQSHPVSVNGDDILKAVAIDLVAPVQKSAGNVKQATNTDSRSLNQTTSIADHMTEDTNIPHNEKKVEEYLLSCIWCHVQKQERMPYVGHQFGYGLKDDTLDPAAHISRHFFEGYWRRKRLRR